MCWSVFFWVLEYARTISNKIMQSAFVGKFSKKSATANQIRSWQRKFAPETVTQDTLQRVWEELDYRLDVRRVTGGTHVEHL